MALTKLYISVDSEENSIGFSGSRNLNNCLFWEQMRWSLTNSEWVNDHTCIFWWRCWTSTDRKRIVRVREQGNRWRGGVNYSIMPGGVWSFLPLISLLFDVFTWKYQQPRLRISKWRCKFWKLIRELMILYYFILIICCQKCIFKKKLGKVEFFLYWFTQNKEE